MWVFKMVTMKDLKKIYQPDMFFIDKGGGQYSADPSDYWDCDDNYTFKNYSLAYKVETIKW